MKTHTRLGEIKQVQTSGDKDDGSMKNDISHLDLNGWAWLRAGELLLCGLGSHTAVRTKPTMEAAREDMWDWVVPWVSVTSAILMGLQGECQSRLTIG